MTERFIRRDPPAAGEIEQLVRSVRRQIRDAVDNAGASNLVVVGMAGTVTTLAAMVLGLDSFDKQKIHGLMISMETLDQWIERLGSMPISERRRLPGMEPGREDLMLQGMLLMREITAFFRAPGFVVSMKGAPYGVIYEAAGKYGT